MSSSTIPPIIFRIQEHQRWNKATIGVWKQKNCCKAAATNVPRQIFSSYSEKGGESWAERGEGLLSVLPLRGAVPDWRRLRVCVCACVSRLSLSLSLLSLSTPGGNIGKKWARAGRCTGYTHTHRDHYRALQTTSSRGDSFKSYYILYTTYKPDQLGRVPIVCRHVVGAPFDSQHLALPSRQF